MRSSRPAAPSPAELPEKATPAYRLLESMQLQQNIAFVAINIAPRKPKRSRNYRIRGLRPEAGGEEADGEGRANRALGSTIRRAPRQREIPSRGRMELHVEDESIVSGVGLEKCAIRLELSPLWVKLGYEYFEVYNILFRREAHYSPSCLL